MELTCKHCGSRFRAAVQLPLTAPVRVSCPACRATMVVKPAAAAAPAEPVPAPRSVARPRVAVIADEPRPFRSFLGEHLRRLGFTVTYYDTGDPVLDFAKRSLAQLVVVNVYLKGKLGVEITEEIKADQSLRDTRVILIGALFRANRFRANPTNLYGADEYIEEQIPERDFRRIIRKLFPELGPTSEFPIEPREVDDARRLARLILSDIVIYHAALVESGIRNNNFFEVLKHEIDEGRRYYESRVPLPTSDDDIFNETLEQFVQMKRDELLRTATGR